MIEYQVKSLRRRAVSVVSGQYGRGGHHYLAVTLKTQARKPEFRFGVRFLRGFEAWPFMDEARFLTPLADFAEPFVAPFAFSMMERLQSCTQAER